MKTAIILGATGLTGGILLKKLLQDPRYGKVKLFSRSSVGISDPKIEEHLVDLLQLEKQQSHFTADAVFCCIGTTKSKTPNKKTYKNIDYGIPLAAARLSEKNNIPQFLVISALGANANSKIFYNKVKGEMERDVLQKDLKNTYIFQPSLIAGNRSEKRSGEQIAKKIMTSFDFLMIGPLKKYRAISPGNIAIAMIWVANNYYKSVRIPSDEIYEIAQNKEND